LAREQLRYVDDGDARSRGGKGDQFAPRVDRQVGDIAGLGQARYLPQSAAIQIDAKDLLGELWNRYTEGANDNASGVGIVLALAEQMRRQAPNLDLWCLITGAEEAGTFGMIRFLEQRGPDFRDAHFLNLDNVGAGTFHFMSGEGMFPTWKSAPPLLELCQQVRDEYPELGVKQGVYNLMSTDALPALARGYSAISFLAVDEAGLLPNWHWLSDTYENVEEGTLNQGQQFVAHLLQRLDQQA